MDERLAHAAELAENGDITNAREIVLALLQEDKTHFDAWHALVQLAENDKERRNAIYKMWGLRPDDPEANLLLGKLKAGSLPPLDDDVENFSSRKYKSQKIASESKNYLGHAILALLVYFFFGVIGTVINIYYLMDVHKQTKLGIETQNVACLWATLIAGTLTSIIFAVVVVILMQAGYFAR